MIHHGTSVLQAYRYSMGCCCTSILLLDLSPTLLLLKKTGNLPSNGMGLRSPHNKITWLGALKMHTTHTTHTTTPLWSTMQIAWRFPVVNASKQLEGLAVDLANPCLRLCFHGCGAWLVLQECEFTEVVPALVWKHLLWMAAIYSNLRSNHKNHAAVPVCHASSWPLSRFLVATSSPSSTLHRHALFPIHGPRHPRP